jgi:glucuronate isomerase
MSFPRHEYFRRVLCNLIGQDMENGELPGDEALLGAMVRNLCFENARKYLDLPIVNNPTGSPSETVTSQRSARG